MSDNYLRLIPTQPRLVPAAESAAYAVERLRFLLPQADKIEAERYDRPTFIDQGANLEAVVCPSCGKRLNFDFFIENDPVTAWWYTATEPLMLDATVDNLRVQMPCCSATVPFASLTFDWPAGVASFEISILNPGIIDGLEPQQLQELGALLGCQLRQIWAHY